MKGIVEQKLAIPSPELLSGIHLNDLTAAFVQALGMMGEKWASHRKRVAIFAVQISEYLNFSPSERETLRLAGLLHDLSVTSPDEQEKRLHQEWEGARKQCLEAAGLLDGFPYLDQVANVIRRQHTHWSHLVESGIDEKTALSANILSLADRIDTFLDGTENPQGKMKEAAEWIRVGRESRFCPEVVDLVLKICQVEGFWYALEPCFFQTAFDRLKPAPDITLTWNELESAALVIARIVDKKSPYTADHSFGVARLCHYFGTRLNLVPETVQKLRIAGLLHDIGKLAIPTRILEKPASLTPEEFDQVKQHPYVTFLVLSGLPGLDEIRDWAAFHHEKGDGSGYPFHLKNESFQIEHLIVMFSDMFRALIQKRPYRGGLPANHIIDILEHLTAIHSTFSPLTNLLREDYAEIEAIARGSAMPPVTAPGPESTVLKNG